LVCCSCCKFAGTGFNRSCSDSCPRSVFSSQQDLTFVQPLALVEFCGPAQRWPALPRYRAPGTVFSRSTVVQRRGVPAPSFPRSGSCADRPRAVDSGSSRSVFPRRFGFICCPAQTACLFPCRVRSQSRSRPELCVVFVLPPVALLAHGRVWPGTCLSPPNLISPAQFSAART
jgi:hypothetical protein